MENTKLLFFDPLDKNKVLELNNVGNEVHLRIEDNQHYIGLYLNKQTTIRLIRELKRQVGIINQQNNE